MADSSTKRKNSKERSKILYQITALVVVVFLVVGIATFFIINSSYNKLIEKSKDELIESEAEIISSSFEYTIEYLGPSIMESVADYDPAEFASALAEKRICEFQKSVNEEIRRVVDSGLLGLDVIMFIAPSSVLSPEPMIIEANYDDLVYKDVPEYIVEALEEGEPYIWREEGLPELGFEGEYLVSMHYFYIADANSDIYVIGLKPMHEEVAAIDGFYNDEKKKGALTLALVILGGVIIVVLITFFVLRHLIRKRITDPVDELSAAAEEVMGGDLDVDVEVHEGGELEGLERAFKEMVESIRKIVARSVGEE